MATAEIECLITSLDINSDEGSVDDDVLSYLLSMIEDEATTVSDFAESLCGFFPSGEGQPNLEESIQVTFDRVRSGERETEDLKMIHAAGETPTTTESGAAAGTKGIDELGRDAHGRSLEGSFDECGGVPLFGEQEEKEGAELYELEEEEEEEAILAQQQQQQWACTECTFENDALLPVCEMCGVANREAEARKAKAEAAAKAARAKAPKKTFKTKSQQAKLAKKSKEAAAAKTLSGTAGSSGNSGSTVAASSGGGGGSGSGGTSAAAVGSGSNSSSHRSSSLVDDTVVAELVSFLVTEARVSNPNKVKALMAEEQIDSLETVRLKKKRAIAMGALEAQRERERGCTCLLSTLKVFFLKF
jgi:uncharacterized membrane protein YgcG